MGKDKEAKGDGPATSVFKGTGRCVDTLVRALVHSASDRNDASRHAIGVSLMELSRAEPALVITTCMDSVMQSRSGKGKKLEHSHVCGLLRLIGKIVDDNRELPEGIVPSMVQFAMSEMTSTRDVVTDQQAPASAILVSLSIKGFGDPVLTELVGTLKSGVVPHYFVLKSLGDLGLATPGVLVPKLKDIMARLLPTLGQIKHAHIRYIFARSLGAMAEAVSLYLAADGPHEFRADDFQSEFFTVNDMMFNRWLADKESEVRLATAHALARIGAVIDREQFEASVPRLVPGVLGLYRKTSKVGDLLTLTRGLCKLFDTCNADGSRVLDAQMPIVLTTIHPLVCKPVNYEVAASAQFHAELLRCFELLAAVFADTILNFAIERMTAREAPLRVGTVSILKHLITRSPEVMAPLADLLVSGVRQMTAEQDNDVALALSELIMVMGHEGYLVHEGGQSLVQFLFRHASGALAMAGAAGAGSGAAASGGSGGAAASPKGGKGGKAGGGAGPGGSGGGPGGAALSPAARKLRSSCERTIERLAADSPTMEDVFWPYVLEFVVPRAFTAGLPVALRVATLLANRKREKGDSAYFVDFAKQVNAPRPQAVVARLLVMLNAPVLVADLGQEILRALLALGPVLSEPVSRMWDKALPRLAAFLSAKLGTDEWDDDVWTDLAQRLFRETVEAQSGEEDWLHALSDDLVSQYDLYPSPSGDDPRLKRTVSVYLGLVLQRINKKQLIRTQLDKMFAVCSHPSAVDRHGCALGFGHAAATHMDICLEKLQHALKNDCVRKSSGFFGMVKDKSVQDVDFVTSTVVLCLGQITSHAPASMVTTRVEVHVLKNALLPTLNDTKTLTRKNAVVRALDLVGGAMHPDALGQEYVLKLRDQLLTTLITLVAPTGEVNTELRILAVRAMSTMVALSPSVPDTLEASTIEAALKFLALPPGPASSSSSSSSPSSSSSSSAGKSPAGAGSEVDELLGEIGTLLSTMLTSNQTLDCLARLLGSLEQWLFSTKSALHRRRAIDLVSHILKKVIDLIGEGNFRAFDGRWKGIGAQLAVVIPRLADQDSAIRRHAMGCLELMLYIDFLLSSSSSSSGGAGGKSRREPPETLASLRDLSSRVTDEDVASQVGVIWTFSTSLATLIDASEVPPLLDTLLSRAQDNEIETVSAPIVVLNGILQQRGPEMADAVPQIVKGLVDNLARARDDKNVNGLLRSFRTLASHHLSSCVDEVLALPLPHAPHVVKCVHVLSRTDKLLTPMLDQLIDIMNHAKFVEPVPEQRNAERVNPKPIAATATLSEIFGAEECLPIALDRYHEIAPTLLLRFGTAVAYSGGKSGTGEAAKFACEALRRFLALTGDTRTLALLEEDGRWDKLSSEATFASVVADIVTSTIGRRPSKHKDVFDFLQSFLTGTNDRQRVVAVTVVAELLACCCAEEDGRGAASSADSSGAAGGGDGADGDDIDSGMGSRKGSSAGAGAGAGDADGSGDGDGDGDGGGDGSSGGGGNEEYAAPSGRGGASSGPHCASSRPGIKRRDADADTDFVRQLLNTLLARQMDKYTEVKVQAMRGLGNIVFAGTAEVNRYSNHVLMALLHGVEDAKEEVALTSMNALAAIFEIIDQSNISGMLVNLALRVRPSFEVAHTGLRAAAHSLFATLCQFSHCEEIAQEAFGDQIHGNLVAVTLHARDDDPDVRDACKRALREIGIFMGVPAIEELLQKQVDDNRDYYDDFLNEFSELLVVHYAGNVNHYLTQCIDPNFKSSWSGITANAATFACSLVANSKPGDSTRVDADTLARELVALLRHQDASVRTKVAKGMSRLVAY